MQFIRESIEIEHANALSTLLLSFVLSQPNCANELVNVEYYQWHITWSQQLKRYQTKKIQSQSSTHLLSSSQSYTIILFPLDVRFGLSLVSRDKPMTVVWQPLCWHQRNGFRIDLTRPTQVAVISDRAANVNQWSSPRTRGLGLGTIFWGLGLEGPGLKSWFCSVMYSPWGHFFRP